MKKIRLSDSEKRLLLLLLAMVLFVGAYFIGFRRNVTAAQAIEAENAKNSVLIGELEAMVNRQAEVEKQTEESRQAVAEIAAKYPSDMTIEKAIEMVQKMENATGVEVVDMNFAMNNLLMDFAGGQAATEAAESGAAQDTEEGDAQTTESQEPQMAETSGTEPKGYYASLTMNYVAGYDSLKKMVDYVKESEERVTIPAISAAYDSETGKLTGTMTLNLYYLTETGREYEEPKFTGIGKGVSDIFKSGAGSVVSNDSQEGESENDQEETDSETDTEQE